MDSSRKKRILEIVNKFSLILKNKIVKKKETDRNIKEKYIKLRIFQTMAVKITYE